MTSVVWHGRHGSVALGPTQDRVARYLADLCRHGWIQLRTAELAERLGLERSEAYRVVARLRALGLFGVSNDRGGHARGRRVWRTAIRHDGATLDPARHRVAWARVRGAARRARVGARARLHQLRADTADTVDPPPASPPPPGGDAGGSFAELVAPLLGAWFAERPRRRST